MGFFGYFVSKSNCVGVLTLTNLSCDTLDEISLHLPPKFVACQEILELDASGNWVPVEFERTEDGVIVNTPARYLDPVYLMFR